MAVHAHGVVHRDMKPENVVITPDDLAKMLDFGVAKARGINLRTTRNVHLGTGLYMAPDRLMHHGEDASPLWDIYSVGVMLWEQAAGRHPFFRRPGDQRTDAEIMKRDEPTIDPALPTTITSSGRVVYDPAKAPRVEVDPRAVQEIQQLFQHMRTVEDADARDELHARAGEAATAMLFAIIGSRSHALSSGGEGRPSWISCRVRRLRQLLGGDDGPDDPAE